MLENGFITEDERDAAKVQKLRYRQISETPTHGEYAAEAARQLIYNQSGDETYTRGLNVYTTIRSKDQRADISEFGLQMAKLFSQHQLAPAPRPPAALAAAYGNAYNQNIEMAHWVPMPTDAPLFK